MNPLIEILALGWLACLFVDWYIGICWENKYTAVKPLNCQKCMGFWIAFFYYSVKLTLFAGIGTFYLTIIYSVLTSLAATIEYSIIKRI